MSEGKLKLFSSFLTALKWMKTGTRGQNRRISARTLLTPAHGTTRRKAFVP